MALAMMVRTRLWLAGEVSPHRDMPLLRQLIERVRRCAAHLPIHAFAVLQHTGIQPFTDESNAALVRNRIRSRGFAPKVLLALKRGSLHQKSRKRHIDKTNYRYFLFPMIIF